VIVGSLMQRNSPGAPSSHLVMYGHGLRKHAFIVSEGEKKRKRKQGQGKKNEGENRKMKRRKKKEKGVGPIPIPKEPHETASDGVTVTENIPL